MLVSAGNLEAFIPAQVFVRRTELGLRHKKHARAVLKHHCPIRVVSAQRRIYPEAARQLEEKAHALIQCAVAGKVAFHLAVADDAVKRRGCRICIQRLRLHQRFAQRRRVCVTRWRIHAARKNLYRIKQRHFILTIHLVILNALHLQFIQSIFQGRHCHIQKRLRIHHQFIQPPAPVKNGKQAGAAHVNTLLNIGIHIRHYHRQIRIPSIHAAGHARHARFIHHDFPPAGLHARPGHRRILLPVRQSLHAFVNQLS